MTENPIYIKRHTQAAQSLWPTLWHLVRSHCPPSDAAATSALRGLPLACRAGCCQPPRSVRAAAAARAPLPQRARAMWRATTERLARLGCRGGGRAASGVPRIGQLLTVRQVVDAHAKHRARYRPPDYCASWNTLGKLVREQAAERRALRAQPELLQPLASATERALP